MYFIRIEKWQWRLIAFIIGDHSFVSVKTEFKKKIIIYVKLSFGCIVRTQMLCSYFCMKRNVICLIYNRNTSEIEKMINVLEIIWIEKRENISGVLLFKNVNTFVWNRIHFASILWITSCELRIFFASIGGEITLNIDF